MSEQTESVPSLSNVLRGQAPNQSTSDALNPTEPAGRPRPAVLPEPGRSGLNSGGLPPQPTNGPANGPAASRPAPAPDLKQTFSIRALNNERLVRVAYWKRKSKGELVNAALDHYLKDFPEALDPVPLD